MLIDSKTKKGETLYFLIDSWRSRDIQESIVLYEREYDEEDVCCFGFIAVRW